MSNFKKILVPIAFSNYSQEILTFGAEIATSLGAEILIINVVNKRDLEAINRITSYGYEVDEDHYLSTIQEERIKKLEEMVKKISFSEDNITFDFRIGDPTDELIKVVIEENVDLVVMGIKSKTGLEYIFTGSVADRFYRQCPVTVISYRDKENSERLRKHFLKTNN
ncbi:MAG: universal stress protein [Deltaproteobacteria bacterium]|jgi:nucleotide-binding universal stress UspA family protein|nr:universal stress protein [Deltaproteobacteria bacterium]